jgi:hypothetical protein
MTWATGVRLAICSVTVLLAVACARVTATPQTPAVASAAPSVLLGTFTDDYDGTYRISPDVWEHGARTRYEIVAWYPDSQYLIARNAATNRADAGQWTRIDWMTLTGMAPYQWAYCLSAYKAPTRDSAQATRVANRGTPRTGCNGFPFSRMRSGGRTQP